MRESRVRIGRWKERVSRKQRARKKRYWSRMGWVARKLGSVAGLFSDEGEVPFVLLVFVDRLLGKGGSGGGGDSGRDGEEGVAFSIRAQVK